MRTSIRHYLLICKLELIKQQFYLFLGWIQVRTPIRVAGNKEKESETKKN